MVICDEIFIFSFFYAIVYCNNKYESGFVVLL